MTINFEPDAETAPKIDFEPDGSAIDFQPEELAYPETKGALIYGAEPLTPDEAAKAQIQHVIDVATGSPIAGLLPRPEGESIGAGIVRGLESTVESLPTPLNIGLAGIAGSAPAIVGKGIAAGFGAHMLKSEPELIGEAITAFKEGKPGTAAEIATGAIANALLGGLAFGHAGSRSRLRAEPAETIETAVDSDVAKILAEPVAKTAAETVIPTETPLPGVPPEAKPSAPAKTPVVGEATKDTPTPTPSTPPLKLYHATSSDFSKFDPSKGEIWLAASPEGAEARTRKGSKRIIEVAVNIEGLQKIPFEGRRMGDILDELPNEGAVLVDRNGNVDQVILTDNSRIQGMRDAQKGDIVEPAKEVGSQGPGAAAATEPLATYEPRKFGERFQETKEIAPEIREATGNRYYEPVPNIKTVAEAEGIITQRGIDESTRLVRDENFPMEHRVRSVMAQGLIKKLNKEFEQTGAPETLNKAVDVAEYLSELGTKLGQGVQSFAVWSRLTPEGMLMSAKRAAKRSGEELSPEATKKITDLTAEINKAPEGFQRDEKTMDLLAYMAELKGVDAADVPTALWYAQILSGYSTQLVNTLDTGLNVLSESAAMAVSHPSAVPQIIGGLYQGLIRGGVEAASVLKTGRTMRGENKLQVPSVLERTVFGTKGGVPISEATVFGRFMKRAFESKVATPLNLWKYPLRAMVASDTALYHSFKEARSRVLARGLAKKEGLLGDKLFKRVDEVLNSTKGRKEVAIKQAESEGLTGLRKSRRISEIIEQGRPEELVSAADEAAKIATYNHRPEGTLGLIADRVGSITEGFKPAKAIVPFTRIVANVTNRALDYSPWGYKRLFFGRSGGKGFASEAPVDEAFRTQLVKATLGTTAMAAVGVLDSAGTIQITAKGPADSDERSQLKNAGWKAYSVKVGDTWYSYQYTPFNLAFAVVGHYRDALRYNKLGEKDVQTRLAYAMLKSGGSVFEMSFLSGVSDFIETIQGAKASTKSAGRILSRTATSVVIPNLVKQLDRLFDPTVYDAGSVQEALVRETPVARGTLRPMLNVLGERIKYDNNRFFAFEKNDPVWRFIVDKQAWVPVPSKTSKIGNRPITPEEYYELIEKSGPKIRASLEQDLEMLKALPAEKAQEVVTDRAISIRKSVKAGLSRTPQP